MSQLVLISLITKMTTAILQPSVIKHEVDFGALLDDDIPRAMRLQATLRDSFLPFVLDQHNVCGYCCNAMAEDPKSTFCQSCNDWIEFDEQEWLSEK